MHAKMTYYTNSNQIKELMTSLVDVPVKPLEKIPKEWWSDATLYIFDNLFRDRALDTYRVGREEDAMTFKTLWMKRPEWGGTILEMMKKSRAVHLCIDEDEWYRVYFCTDGLGPDFFQFVSEKPPVLNTSPNCLISTEESFSKEMDAVLVELCEPIRFGQSVMQRLCKTGGTPSNKDTQFVVGDYTDLSYKLERLARNAQHQRDLWKDRFFFRAINADEDELCEMCKEDMRRTFYDESNEVAALRWRPGDGCGGVCKYGGRYIEELEDIKE